jgi:hypothetical protein
MSERMLTDRFALAHRCGRQRPQGRRPGAREAIEGMILRDCRKYAADLAASAQDAQQLLQHGSIVTTMRTIARGRTRQSRCAKSFPQKRPFRGAFLWFVANVIAR